MSTQRVAYWWFRFVFSGRFLETFLTGRHRAAASPARGLEPDEPRRDPPKPSADKPASFIAAE